MPFRPVFDEIFTVWTAIACGVFVIVTGLLLYAIVRNRARRRTHLPFVRDANNPLEIAYAVGLGLVAAGLVTGSFLAMAKVNEGAGLAEAATSGPDAVHIDVTAFRWCWDFGYAGTARHVTGDCAQSSPTIVVPAGRPVEFDVTSRDVIHAFWLPDFAAKVDASPGNVNPLRMIFPAEGRYRGRCSEYCGVHHTTMDFYVEVVTPAQYQQFRAGAGASA
jgi:cytochrome c oxidase subunit 2